MVLANGSDTVYGFWSISPTLFAKHVANKIVRGFLFLSLAPITNGTSETGNCYLKSKPSLYQRYRLVARNQLGSATANTWLTTEATRDLIQC